MTCPSCGATMGPHDRFCVRCGHDMQSAAARPATAAGPNPNAGPTAAPSSNTGPIAQPPFNAYPNANASAGTPSPGQAANNRWASGSSVPGPNPYAQAPNTVSGGTMLNDRPVSGNKNGLLQGLGAAVIALGVILGKFGIVLGVILGKFGAAIAGIGFFKLFFFVQIVRAFTHGGLGGFGGLALLLVVVLIVGAIWRARTA